MLNILQASLQQYMNQEHLYVQAGFRKGRGTRDQTANIHWIIKKAREFQKKYLLLLYWLCQSLWSSQQVEVDVFWNSLVFSMIQWVLAVWSLVPLPFLNPAWTSGSSRFMYCWSLAWRILSFYLASMWNECNCVLVRTFFGIALVWDWNENWPFPILWPLLSFPNLLDILSAALSQHHFLGFEIAQLEFHHLH